LIISGSDQNEKELFGSWYTGDPRSLVQATQPPCAVPTFKLFPLMPLKRGMSQKLLQGADQPSKETELERQAGITVSL